ncbi:MAG: ATP-binding protein [Cyanobacteria bacterium P01_G01_bin.38]
MSESASPFFRALEPSEADQPKVGSPEMNPIEVSQAHVEAFNEHLNALFDRALDGIFVTDLEGRYHRVNNALARLYGYDSPAHLIKAQPLLRGQLYVDPSTRPALLAEIATTGSVANHEIEIYRRDGSQLWISETCWPICDRDGTPLYYEGFVRDITARKQIETALKQREHENQAIISAIPDLMFRVNRDGIYLGYVGTHKFHDLLPEDFEPKGQHLSAALPPEIAERHLYHLAKALQTGEAQVYEQIHAFADRLQAEEVRVVPVDEDEALFMIRDISSRKQAEAALIQKNQELEDTLTQLQAAQTGLAQADKMVVLGRLIAGIAHEINTPLGAIQAASSNAEGAIAIALPKLPTQIAQLSEAEQTCFINLIVNPIQKPLATREKRQQRRLITQQLDAWNIDSARTLADILVDIGTSDPAPLLPLLQQPEAIDILDLAYDLISVRRNNQTIKLAVERAANVVSALKSYAHQDFRGEKNLIQISDTVETVLTLYQNQIKSGIELIRDYQPVPPLLCYPDELSQIWTNLIQNAIQAMKGEGRLEVGIHPAQVERDAYAGPCILVTITDQGPGIPADIVTRVFDPFFTTKPIGEGTGLGLNICQKIVEKHRGWITIDSLPGRTCFEIGLPLEVD